MSLRNFYVNIITFWSSQGDLSSKKNKKTEEKVKDKIVTRLVKNVTRFDKADCIVSTLFNYVNLIFNINIILILIVFI